MKVLLVGELFSQNLGDQLIYQCTKRQVLQIDSSAEFILMDIMGRNQNDLYIDFIDYEKLETLSTKTPLSVQLSKYSVVDYLIKKKSVHDLKSYYASKITSDIDFAIFTGGALIQDTFALYIDTIVSMLQKKKIPVVFNSVDVGSRSWINKIILRRLLNRNNIKGISCRCRIERFNGIVQSEKINSIISSYDSAILCSRDAQNETVDKNITVGLGIMNSSRYPQNELKNFWIGVINCLNRQKVSWKVFTTGSQNDNALAISILKSIYGNNYRAKITIPLNTNDLINIIASFERILSFRLHSHIIAYSLGIPSVGVIWDTKIIDFFKKTKRSHYLCNITDPPELIVSKVLRQEVISEIELLTIQEKTDFNFHSLVKLTK